MIDIKTIKLVVWDLDDTFWSGTISEGEITPIAAHVQLIHDLTDCGIINTICSKNDQDITEKKLRELGVWEEFVFASINWDNKAMRLQAQIDGMALRPANVLFIDDNHFNLQEAQHAMPMLQVAEPQDAIPELIRQVAAAEKKDLTHKRLGQYKVLEQKAKVSLSYESGEDFLYATQIKVRMVELRENVSEQLLLRLHELVMRTNQLNFTKNRCPIGELRQRIEDSKYRCGYVEVHDKFGDYGIVGFYVLNMEANELEHFLFSCRTMGQKIEQWVYAQLRFPRLKVVGEVRTQLNTTEVPGWINQVPTPSQEETISHKSERKKAKSKGKILLKGPCDLSNSEVYIKNLEQFDTDFAYVTEKGQIIEAHNHSVMIAGLMEYTEEDRRVLSEECCFVDPKMFDGRFFTNQYDVIFLSSLIEYNLKIYRRKGSELKIPFGSAAQDLTNPKHWDSLVEGRLYCSQNKFTKAYLQSFAEKYENIEPTSPETYKDFLQKTLAWLSNDTTLCIILGATKFYDEQDNQAAFHREINKVVKALAAENPRLRYIELDSFIHTPKDYDGSIDHFTTRVYYDISQAMVATIEEVTGNRVEKYSRAKIWVDQFMVNGRKIVKKHVGGGKTKLYGILQKIYLKIRHKRSLKQ